MIYDRMIVNPKQSRITMSASQFNDSLVHPMQLSSDSFIDEKLEDTKIYEDDVEFVEEHEIEFTHNERMYMCFGLTPKEAIVYERLCCNYKRARFNRESEPDYVEEPEWPDLALPDTLAEFEKGFEKAMEAEPRCNEGDTVYFQHRFHTAGSWPTGGDAYLYEIDYLQKENGVMVHRHFCGFKETAPRHFTFLIHPCPFTFNGTPL